MHVETAKVPERRPSRGLEFGGILAACPVFQSDALEVLECLDTAGDEGHVAAHGDGGDHDVVGVRVAGHGGTVPGKRLGGAEGVSSIASDLVDLHRANPIIGTRFLEVDVDEIKGLVRDHLGSGTGGPEEYTGRDMTTTHTGMNLSEEEFVAALDDALKALDKNSVGQREKEEVLFILYSVKDEILRK